MNGGAGALPYGGVAVNKARMKVSVETLRYAQICVTVSFWETLRFYNVNLVCLLQSEPLESVSLRHSAISFPDLPSVQVTSSSSPAF